MKKSDSHLRLTWRLDLALHIPIEHKRAASIANRVLMPACLVTLALGLAPLVSLLLTGP